MRPKRRPSSLIAALMPCLALVVGGCGSIAKKSAPAAPGPDEKLTLPEKTELGRIRSIQLESRTALVEFTPTARPPAALAGRALLARKLDTLEESARLVASGHQRGRILGVYVISGAPTVDDEVVLLPEP